MILPNLYGNIATNLCCGLVGGPGLIAGSNYSNTTRSKDLNSIGVFEVATRNTAEDLVGQDEANPTAFLMAGVKLLEFHGQQEHADMIRNAVNSTISGCEYGNRCHTKDIGGNAGTKEFMNVFYNNLKGARPTYKMDSETIGQKKKSQ